MRPDWEGLWNHGSPLDVRDPTNAVAADARIPKAFEANLANGNTSGHRPVGMPGVMTLYGGESPAANW
jgi:hypothetical protein